MPRRSQTGADTLRLVGQRELSRDVVGATPRLKPTSDLSREQQAVWYDIVNSVPAEHFTPVNGLMLAQLCRHVIIARQFSDLYNEVASGSGDATIPAVQVLASLAKAQESQSRIIHQLMTSLRLTPQSTQLSRTSPKAMQQLTVRKPWEREPDGETS